MINTVSVEVVNLDALNYTGLQNWLGRNSQWEALDPEGAGKLVTYAQMLIHKVSCTDAGKRQWQEKADALYATLPVHLQFRPKPKLAKGKKQKPGKSKKKR